MRVAVGQVTSGEDKDRNLAAIAEMVSRAKSLGADVVAFPEYAMFKQPIRDADFLTAAEDLDGPFATKLRGLAEEHGIGLIVGLVERIPDEERAYNTILVLGPEGEDLAVYRKIHLYDAFGGSESDWIRPGGLDQPLVFDLEGIRFGLMTCYDIRFPEMARLLVDLGAQVIVVPTAWTPGPRKEDHWNTLVRARAIENTVYVVAPGLAPPMCTGGSLIVDPMGVVIAEIGEAAGMVFADLTAERVAEVRGRNPALEHRRLGGLAR